MRKKNGFTMIELLAVLVVLVILSFIAIPKMLNIIEEARKDAFIESVHSANRSIKMYLSSHIINVPEEGISISNFEKYINNYNFNGGTITENENKELIFSNVSDGSYCANGTVENLLVTKGDCVEYYSKPKNVFAMFLSNANDIVIIKAKWDDEFNDIVKFEFSVDGGEWIDNGVNDIRRFEDLEPGTHTFKVRVTNSLNETAESEEIIVETGIPNMPVFTMIPEENYAKERIVTIDYPERLDGFIYEYSLDKGATWTIVYPDASKTLIFDKDSTLVARVYDGEKYVTTPIMHVIGFDQTEPSAGIELYDKGDSLYQIKTICKDNESGIIDNAYSLDGGSSYKSLGKHNKEDIELGLGTYILSVRCTNGAGIVSYSETVLLETVLPYYTITGAQYADTKTVTITYPKMKEGYKYEYSLDEGVTWIETTNSSETIEFKKNGSVIARVYNGVKYVTASMYTITGIIGGRVNSIEELQSPHPYNNGTDATWIYQLNNASSIDVKFNNLTFLNSTSVIYIYDKNDGLVGTYTGSSLANQIVSIVGDTIKIRLVASGSGSTGNPYGFKVDSIDITSGIGFIVSPNSEFAERKVVTITYPERKVGYKFDYSLDLGETWIPVTSGNSVSVEFTSNGNIIARVYDGEKYINSLSYVVEGIDTTEPIPTIIVSSIKDSVGEKEYNNKVAISFSCEDLESGVYRYYSYSTDNGNSYIESVWQSYSSQQYATLYKVSSPPMDVYNLDPGMYYFKLKCTNKAGIEKVETYEYKEDRPTIVIENSDYYTTTKEVTLNYPQGDNYTYQYSIDEGEWLTVDTYRYTFEIDRNQLIKTRVYDGNKYIEGMAVEVGSIIGTTETSDVEKLQSPHPYSSKTNATWTYKHPSETTSLDILFDENTILSSGDYIYIYDYEGKQVGEYTNRDLQRSIVTVPGNKFTIKLLSTIGGSYGFKVSSVGASYGISYTITPDGYATSKTLTILFPEKEENYVYEYSLDLGVTWQPVDGRSKELLFTANGSVIARIFDGTKYMTSLVYTVTGIDNTAPAANIGKYLDGNVERIKAYCDDLESGIQMIEYSTDGGSKWSENEPNINYSGLGKYVVRCTNGAGIVSTSDILVIEPIVVEFEADNKGSGFYIEKNITITYPDRKAGYIYQYSVDNGNDWITLESGKVTTVKFTENGLLIARIYDGEKYLYYNYKVTNIAGGTVTNIDNLESPHPYLGNMDATWTYVVPNSPDSIEVLFDASTYVETNVDYIYIYDKNDNLIGTYTGYELKNQRIVLTGDTVKIRVKTSGSNNYYGFKVLSATANIGISYSVTPNTDYATKKTVTIYYPSGNYIKQYSLNNGETWITTTDYYQVIEFTKNGTILTRVYDGSNYLNGSTYIVTGIDTTNPNVDITVKKQSETSYQVIGTCTDSESGVSKYEFSKDGGIKWNAYTSSNESYAYTFTDLTVGSYNFVVRCTNKAGLVSTSKTMLEESLTPSYNIDTTKVTNRKVVTITYPERNNNYIYEYSLDLGESWLVVEGTANKKEIVFTSNGSVIARVNTGEKYVTASSYTVSGILEGVGGVVTSVEELQSPHQYSNNMDITWEYTLEGEPTSIEVVFSEDTSLYSSDDYVYIYDQTGLEVGKFYGAQLKNKKVIVSGDTVKIRLVTSSSGTSYGFRVLSVTANVGITYSISPTSGWAYEKIVNIYYPNRIEGYKYEYTVDEGNTWIEVTGTIATIKFTENGSVIARIFNGKNYQKAMTYMVTDIDSTKPIVDLEIIENSANSYTLNASCSDPETGITKYEFTNDGNIWTSVSSTKETYSYTYSALDSKTYNFAVRCTNGAKNTETSGLVHKTVLSPEYSIDKTKQSNEKTVTILYPERQSGYIYEYTTDEGNTWVEVEGTVATVKFTNNGTIIARIFDGEKYVTASTYVVSGILEGIGGVIENISDLESPHNCPANIDVTWEYTMPGVPDNMVVVFDTRTYVYGTMYLYDKNNNLIGTYSNNIGAIKVNVTGDTIKIRVVTDNSSSYYGFKVDSIIVKNGIEYVISPDKTYAPKKSLTIIYPTGLTTFTYQYSIDDGNTWVTLNGTNTVTLEFTENTNVLMRYYDDNIYVNGASYMVTGIDTTEPVLSMGITQNSSNYYIIYGYCSDNESRVSKYEFSKDGGTTWAEYSSNNSSYSKSYELLDEDVTEFMVRCTNGAGLTTTVSEEVTIVAPEFEISVDVADNVRLINVIYPEKSNYQYEYSIDNGVTWKYSSSNRVSLKFPETGTIIARIYDGTKYVTSSTYSVTKNTLGGLVTNIEKLRYYEHGSRVDAVWSYEGSNLNVISFSNSNNYIPRENVDYVYIYNKNNELLYTITGNAIYEQDYYVYSDLIKIRFDKNGTGYYSGFYVDSITQVENVEFIDENNVYATEKTIRVLFGRNDPHEYSLDGGTTWITTTSQILDLKFTKDTVIKARYKDYEDDSDIYTYEVTGFDSTLPNLTGKVTVQTTTLYRVYGYCNDPESGVKQYGYSIDGGNSWKYYTSTSANHNVDFNVYDIDTTLDIKVKCINGAGLEKVIDVEVLEILNPVVTSRIDYDTNYRIATITYPERQQGFIYEYSLDAGKTWEILETGTIKEITFTKNGSVIARIYDGTKYLTSSTYSITGMYDNYGGIVTDVKGLRSQRQIDTADGEGSVYANSRTIWIYKMEGNPTSISVLLDNYTHLYWNSSYANKPYINIMDNDNNIIETITNENYTNYRNKTVIIPGDTIKIELVNPTSYSSTYGFRVKSVTANVGIDYKVTPITQYALERTVTLSYLENNKYVYQYSVDLGETWETIPHTNYDIKFTENKTLLVRMYNGSEYINALSYTLTGIDTTPPEAKKFILRKDSANAYAITTASCTDSESGVSNYYYSKDGGKTWQNSYNFTNLGNDRYEFVYKCVNRVGLETLSEIEVINLLTPEYVMNLPKNVTSANEKVVTIVYPEREYGYVYEYSFDNGESWNELVDGITIDIPFTNNGTLIARIFDGEKYIMASTYTISNIIDCCGKVDRVEELRSQLRSKGTGADGEGNVYANSLFTWEYTLEGNPTSISVLLDNYTHLYWSTSYANKPYIKFMDKEGNVIETITNENYSSYRNVSIVIPGDTVKIELVNPTSYSSTYGFRVKSITANNGISYSITPTDKYTTKRIVTITYPQMIDGYIYEYSRDGGNTWTEVLESTINIEVKENTTIIARIHNGAKYLEALSYAVTGIDTTPPINNTFVVKPTSANAYSFSNVSCSDSESGVSNYYYSKDGGKTWQNSTSFTNLEMGAYQFVMKCKNNAGLETIGEPYVVNLFTPEYKLDIPSNVTSANEKTVIITYPNKESGYIYEYSRDNGNTWITLETGTIARVKYSENGTLIARVFDGEKYIVASTYTISNIIDCCGKVDRVEELRSQLRSKGTGADGEGNVYANSLFTWEYTLEGNPTSISVLLDNYTHLYWSSSHANKPYIKFMDKEGNVIEIITNENYSSYRNVSIVIPGDTVKIELVNPISYSSTYGFRVKSITANNGISYTVDNKNKYASSRTINIVYPIRQDGYIYEYSTDLGQTWVTVEGVSTNVKFTENGTLIARIYDGTKYIESLTYSVTGIDNKYPVVSITNVTEPSNNSVKVEASCSDDLSGVGYYSYSKDGGLTWDYRTNTKTYTYTNLIPNKYNFVVKCEDSVGNATLSEPVSKEIIMPLMTYTPEVGGIVDSRLITIYYPERENGYIYEYTIDGGINWLTVESSNVKELEITRNRSLVIARMYDGVKYYTTESYLEQGITGGVVTDIEDLQSPHDYYNKMDLTWIYTLPGNPSSIQVVFDSQCELEKNSDKVYIYDKNDTLIGTYTGTELQNKSITITGDTVKIRLKTSNSTVKYGFKVTSVTAAN